MLVPGRGRFRKEVPTLPKTEDLDRQERTRNVTIGTRKKEPLFNMNRLGINGNYN